MFKQRYALYLQLMDEVVLGKVSGDVMMQETVLLLKDLKEALARAEGEERQEILNMMQDLNTNVIKVTQRIEKATGLSEKDLIAYANNPKNFTKDQWDRMQAAKVEAGQSHEEISSILSKKDKQPSSSSSKSADTRKKKNRALRRQHWIKS